MTLAEIRNACRPLVPDGWTAFYTLDVADYSHDQSTTITYRISLVLDSRCERVQARTPEALIVQFHDMIAGINRTPQSEVAIYSADAGEFAEVPA